ncbi:MAG: hypothetical protein J1F04_01625 [Oscillospiraceae bacterium]|nr:hypothetical protein [Oscillospiraceae bacterium]
MTIEEASALVMLTPEEIAQNILFMFSLPSIEVSDNNKILYDYEQNQK